MLRNRLQNIFLIALVAILLVAVVRIYETYLAQTPTNLKGNIAIDGATTANPPAP
jgi:hypothetical protein